MVDVRAGNLSFRLPAHLEVWIYPLLGEGCEQRQAFQAHMKGLKGYAPFSHSKDQVGVYDGKGGILSAVWSVKDLLWAFPELEEVTFVKIDVAPGLRYGWSVKHPTRLSSIPRLPGQAILGLPKLVTHSHMCCCKEGRLRKGCPPVPSVCPGGALRPHQSHPLSGRLKGHHPSF